MLKKTKTERFEALDILRGLTMVIMALDHARDFFSLGYVYASPMQIGLTNMEVFFTRWITHFAAPTFIFLAGIGLFFASKRRTKNELASLAISRGLWLIFLELTLIGFFWSFNSDFIYHPKIAVLFAIGVCMIFMGFFVYLPKYLIAIVAFFMIFGHNFFDDVLSQSFGTYSWIWQILHENGSFYVGDIEVRVVYPFVPWIGVMAAGYLFGPLTKLPRVERKKVFLSIGMALVIFGLILRYTNVYGDLLQWQTFDNFKDTFMSFLNFTKYPPSLIYLSVFIGFALIFLSVFDRDLGRWASPLKNFGQAPFFFYILHIPILHLFGIILALVVFNDASWLFGAPQPPSPEGLTYGFELLPTYIAWITVVIILYFPSKWFAEFKTRRKDWWISYL